MSCGYGHPYYVQSLARNGGAIRLPESGGWLITRQIPGTPYRDAVGPYPLLACADWKGLSADLDALAGSLVSVVAVPDPAATGLPELRDSIRSAFSDMFRPFKKHYAVDLERSWEDDVSAHHRRNARKALRHLVVEACTSPLEHAADWVSLYAHLVRFRGVTGSAEFSPEALERQLQVPGTVMFRARRDGVTLGATVWFRCESRAFYHLGAYTPAGYGLGASHAIFSEAFRWFSAEGIRWLALGGGPGLRDDPASGLRRFKAGWANVSHAAYLAGRVLDRKTFDLLSDSAASRSRKDFFPPYRVPSAGKDPG